MNVKAVANLLRPAGAQAAVLSAGAAVLAGALTLYPGADLTLLPPAVLLLTGLAGGAVAAGRSYPRWLRAGLLGALTGLLLCLAVPVSIAPCLLAAGTALRAAALLLPAAFAGAWLRCLFRAARKMAVNAKKT